MRWISKPKPNQETVLSLSNSLGIDKVLATLLVQRGVDTFEKAKSFFRPNLAELHNPFLMKGMEAAVQRIFDAIENNETIMVFGDYDVDGTTAVALMSSYLLTLHPNVVTYIPDRYAEGYGISTQGIDFADDNNISLIIALDCGIKAIDKVAYAKEKNIDFIICDHHRPGANVPDAVAVLDPKQTDCHYPFDELSGCGVGFKVIQAIAQVQEQPFEELIPYLDLLAVSIAADIVPMDGENRILAYHGLKVINSNPRPGIKAVLEQIQKTELTITDVVFMIAPRINAAGRMKQGIHAVELLTEQDMNLAKKFAREIDQYNADRKELDKKITDEAIQQIRENNEEQNSTSVVFCETWHKGVIGIVASRLIENYYRPTLVFTKSGEKLAASARSVKGFDVYNALEACSEHIEQFGGHKYAAGLTLLPENYTAFKRAFEQVVKETLSEEQKTPEIILDAEVDLIDLNPKFYRILSQFAPFGPANMKPVFKATGLRDNGYGKRIGKVENENDLPEHLRLNIIYGADDKTYNAIGFGMGNQLEDIVNAETFEAAFTLEENNWNGYTSLQLMLKDVRVTE
ncbi:single-stranded-DNA-specific exonuclease RecJ [Wenyingzhuangia marina]|uniref:Single-stranded-DNA-specific exonuclease RecJ n=1 Tax=Wenyingzhuangia marina TaxID=1195760 RepID=A0A1M5S3L9_9FLAO|nr:single-stranded-DNA-specific exonuclease RecJ [Wenyingzhuangia marina]GGF78603.1 single-stranded-DNA-specific exonuclease RecJ [Wenyingzhuangia marina]SHH32543.1 exonuclease RecJ [Wenyingzhuangia marina]